MEPQKFSAQYKCDCFESNRCNCPRKSQSTKYFMDNIRDIANTLADVMCICGIHEAKAKAATDVIAYSFLHYDEIRHRIDAVPRKRLCKEDLIHDLGRKCLMNRMEAQLTYSIIKRAFKAFYYGTSEGGIRNRALEAEALHSQECLWVHAAKRTAQIFANYEGMFFSAQQSYEAQIKCAYKRLYDQIQKRKFPLKPATECQCQGCTKTYRDQMVQDDSYNLHQFKGNMHLEPVYRDDKMPGESCELYSNKKVLCNMDSEHSMLECNMEAEQKTKANSSKISFDMPRCYQCNCPKLVCDCDVDRDTGVLTIDCSQGPYKCNWVRVDKDDKDDIPDPCLTVPENHQCPIDCDEVSRVTCDEECICDCSDDCECPIEEESSGYDDDPEDLEDESFEIKFEEEEVDFEPPQYDLPDISEREPTDRYDGCRVQLNHIVEETSEEPVTIASVEEHRKEIRVMSETLPSKASSSEPVLFRMKPATRKKSLKKNTKESTLSAEERRKEGEEIVKLLAELI